MTDFYHQFKTFFQEDEMLRLARKIGWFHRIRVLSPYHLVLTLLAAMLSKSAKTITQLQSYFCALSSRIVSYQPFYDKLAQPQCPIFLKSLLRLLLSRWSLRVLEPMPSSKLSQFQDILIQDGSSLRLHPELAEVFPGRWLHSPAAVEIHLTYSLFQESPARLIVAPDKEAEKNYLFAPSEAKGKLVLLDRGYFDRAFVKNVADAGGHVVVRARKNLNPLIVGLFCNDKLTPVGDVPLKKLRPYLHGQSVDAIVRWKDLSYNFRLLGLWNPQTEEHTWLLTTLDLSWSKEEIGQLYRLRWQVELCFKEWKSSGNLRRFCTRNPEIAESLLLASLMATAVWKMMTYSAEGSFGEKPLSTARSLSCLGFMFSFLSMAMFRGDEFKEVWENCLTLIHNLGGRFNTKRECEKGRRSLGLKHVLSH